MNEKILGFLRDSEVYVSGQDIARKLSLSRQGLWKHIQDLRRLGYEIEAVPHLGYKLLKRPDRLYPWEIEDVINTKSLGKKIVYYDSVFSTMDKAWELGEQGSREGVLVCAEKQTKGRGRLGRSWISPKYKGLYFSLLLRPDILPSNISCITLLSALAVLKGIKKEINIPLSIKWPNDILAGDKKLAGILTEAHTEQDRINFIVSGIGININSKADELTPGAVSLYLCLGRKADRLKILKGILEEYEKYYTEFKLRGPAAAIEEWKKFSYVSGVRVKVLGIKGFIEGRAIDLDSDGALLIRKDSGMVERVTAGDIVRVKE
jgi:BirA family transcriptional regulator, biotin operon repressor / biotin---[acetyl-CoA-carboxylase] ligase